MKQTMALKICEADSADSANLAKENEPSSNPTLLKFGRFHRPAGTAFQLASHPARCAGLISVVPPGPGRPEPFAGLGGFQTLDLDGLAFNTQGGGDAGAEEFDGVQEFGLRQFHDIHLERET